MTRGNVMKLFSYCLISSATMTKYLIIISGADQGWLYRILLFNHPGSNNSNKRGRGGGGFAGPSFYL
jgi:hypothetical protein